MCPCLPQCATRAGALIDGSGLILYSARRDTSLSRLATLAGILARGVLDFTVVPFLHL